MLFVIAISDSWQIIAQIGARALQKGRAGRREQDPDLYDCFTCSALEVGAARGERAGEAWPAV